MAILAYLLLRELGAYLKRFVNLMNSDFGVLSRDWIVSVQAFLDASVTFRNRFDVFVFIAPGFKLPATYWLSIPAVVSS